MGITVRDNSPTPAPAPTDPARLTLPTMTTKPSFRAEFSEGEGGKTAVYMARWVNTRGEKGRWSEITSLDMPSAGPTVAA